MTLQCFSRNASSAAESLLPTSRSIQPAALWIRSCLSCSSISAICSVSEKSPFLIKWCVATIAILLSHTFSDLASLYSESSSCRLYCQPSGVLQVCLARTGPQGPSCSPALCCLGRTSRSLHFLPCYLMRCLPVPPSKDQECHKPLLVNARVKQRPNLSKWELAEFFGYLP